MISVAFSNIDYGEGFTQIRNLEEAFSVSVSGHSGKGKKGEDIFCAGVSVLSQTMALALARDKELDVKIEQSDGFLKALISVKNIQNREALVRVSAVLDFFLTGIAELSNIEPERLAVRFN